MATTSAAKNLRSGSSLGWATVAFTYFLMVWGNLVSSTGSGLACPDWPLCHGTVTPPARAEILLEWGHRLLAATATVLIVMTLWRVVQAIGTGGRQSAALRKSGFTLLGLLAAQIILGGVTVLLGLSVAVSTVHLLNAHFVFGGLILVACSLQWGSELSLAETKDTPALAKVRRLSLAGLAGLGVQLGLGAVVRHGHAGLACSQFPLCLESFWPLPWTFETSVAFIHRWWGFSLLALFVHLAVAAPKAHQKLANWGRGILGLAILQVSLGVMTVWTGLQVHTRATHAAVGYLLWGVLCFIVFRSGGLRQFWAGPGLAKR